VISGNVGWCRNPKTNRKLPFDMILELLKIIIEVDGPQHTEPFKFFNKTMSFNEIKERDRYKEETAKKTGYSVIRIYANDVWRDLDNWQKKLLEALENGNDKDKKVIWLYQENMSGQLHNLDK